jgi:hypothetical protein
MNELTLGEMGRHNRWQSMIKTIVTYPSIFHIFIDEKRCESIFSEILFTYVEHVATDELLFAIVRDKRKSIQTVVRIYLFICLFTLPSNN